MRYSSSLDLATWTKAALAELPDEPLKAFLLSALAGLRKNEIDKLQWSAFDFERKTLRVNVSEHGTLKSEDSIGDVDLDVELAELFHGYRAKARGPFVIASEQLKPAAKPAGYTRYRADLVFSGLVDWRRSTASDPSINQTPVELIEAVQTLASPGYKQLARKSGLSSLFRNSSAN
jgi:integrase